MNYKTFRMGCLVTVFAVTFCFIGCGSSGDADEGFLLTADLEGREEILKNLFTEEMYNTITEESRNHAGCKEGNRAEILPEDVQGIPNGQWYYTYDNLITGMAKMEKFATESDDDNINKLEIAAFLANIAQETGVGFVTDPIYGGPGCAIQEGYGSQRDSCVYGGCVNTPGYDSNEKCNAANEFKCPAGDIGWGGRGPHQLSWGVNYQSFGEAMGVGSEYKNDPDLLTIYPEIGIAGSIWFWGYAEKSASYPPHIPFKPSGHNVIVGKWTPTDHDIACGRTEASLGIITNIINGGIECGPDAEGHISAQRRVIYFNNIAEAMGVDVPEGFATDCATQQNFAACPSYKPTPDDPTRRCGIDWTDANTKCGTYCVTNAECPGGETCFADLSPIPCRQ